MFKGGSAYIINGALDDLGLNGKLITIDLRPGQIEIGWKSIAHNTRSVKGYFQKDIEKVLLPGSAKYNFAFVDGDHSFDAVVNDLLDCGNY
jgi:hypothetical protein